MPKGNANVTAPNQPSTTTQGGIEQGHAFITDPAAVGGSDVGQVAGEVAPTPVAAVPEETNIEMEAVGEKPKATVEGGPDENGC